MADKNASANIDKQIADLKDWRGPMIAKLRKVILASSPDIVEDWKWDTGVWAANGNVVSVGAFKDHVKINFFKGASLKDPKKLFNAGLEAKSSRGIDFSEGDGIDEAGITELVREAVALNKAGKK